jgi:hypothetical protein
LGTIKNRGSRAAPEGGVEGFERWRDQAAEEKPMKTKKLKVLHRLRRRRIYSFQLGMCN